MIGKKKPAIFISIILVIGFSATSLASYFVSRSLLRSQITKKELPLTSDNIYSEIQRDLLRPIFISSLMANDTFLRDWVLDGEKMEAPMIRYLHQIQEKYHTFTSFFVSDHTRIYYHSDGILKKVREDEPRDKWYFRVRQMESDFEINVDPDMANEDSMTIFINYKVFDYDNRFIGATGVGLTVSAVKDLIRRYQEDYDRRICFVDKSGLIKLQSAAIGNNINNIRDIDGLDDIADEVLYKEKGDFKYKYKGKTIYLNTRYIPEFDWYLLVEQKEGTAIRPILHALFVNIAICIGITLLVLALITATVSGYQKRLEKMATMDKLTGIYNRQAFEIIITQALKDIRRKKQPLSIILFDIDQFKSINDEHGHLAGDAAIKHIVALTRDAVRESDMLCRWGGEEFLVILWDCGIEDGFRIAEKIRQAVEGTPLRHGTALVQTTISSGVAEYERGESQDDLLTRADQCLYQAKHAGRNQTVK